MEPWGSRQLPGTESGNWNSKLPNCVLPRGKINDSASCWVCSMCVLLAPYWISTGSVHPVLSLCSICVQLLSVSCQLVVLRPINEMLMPFNRERKWRWVRQVKTVAWYLISPATQHIHLANENRTHLPVAAAFSWQPSAWACPKLVRQCKKLLTSLSNWTDNLWAFLFKLWDIAL